MYSWSVFDNFGKSITFYSAFQFFFKKNLMSKIPPLYKVFQKNWMNCIYMTRIPNMKRLINAIFPKRTWILLHVQNVIATRLPLLCLPLSLHLHGFIHLELWIMINVNFRTSILYWMNFYSSGCFLSSSDSSSRRNFLFIVCVFVFETALSLSLHHHQQNLSLCIYRILILIGNFSS